MNEILLFAQIIIIFSIVLLAKKFFGKTGLFVWMALASCIAQVGAAKTVTLFGLGTSAGSVLFASTFLVTDILSESYGKKEARKAVYIGALSIVGFVIATSFINFMNPAPTDYASSAVATLFGLVPRISAASLIMYFVANLADVLLFNKLKEATNGKYLWLRNNVSTVLCNGLENFLFFTLAFAGLQDWKVIFEMAVSTTIVEAIIAVCDTPFLYASKKVRDKA
jgi:uncharacterized integral membrane protein (TIGR00697 family)